MGYTLRLLNILDRHQAVQSFFFKDVSTFNVTFSDMNDDFLSLIIDGKVCIWIGPNGQIGQVETLSSSYLDNEKLHLEYVTEMDGIPLFEVVQDLKDQIINLQLRKDDHTFSIFWGDSSEDCKVVRSNDCSFLIQNDLFVGIEVEQYSLE